ncbi:MAG: hypothetical protein PHQ28_12730 [Mycobacterium sp.]|nr:hypothetical protein [Mycobacterium sp.]
MLLNAILALQSQLINCFSSHAERHGKVGAEDKAILSDTYAGINPAAVQRQIHTLIASKAGPRSRCLFLRRDPHVLAACSGDRSDVQGTFSESPERRQATSAPCPDGG